MTHNLSIIIVEKDADRAALISGSLASAGGYDVLVLADETQLAQKTTEHRPDVVLIDIAQPTANLLSALLTSGGSMVRPVAVFVDRSDPVLTHAAIQAGASAYVVDGLRADRIKPILDAAISRFGIFQAMRDELAATKRALEDRKTIDRAKTILMRAKRISEEEAYTLLRKTAMDQGRKLADVAEALVTTAGLLT